MAKFTFYLISSFLFIIFIDQSQCQNIACVTKLGECAKDLNMTALTEMVMSGNSDATKFETECNDMKTKAASCIAEAKTICADDANQQAAVASLETMLSKFCGKENVCQLKAAKCGTPISLAMNKTMSVNPSAGGPASPPDVLAPMKAVCPVYPKMKECLQNLLDGECKGQESVVNASNVIKQYEPTCQLVNSGKNICVPAMGCLVAGGAPQGSCEYMVNMVKCLSKLKDQCSLDDSKYTFTQLISKTDGMCAEVNKYPKEQANCSAMNMCILKSPKLGMAQMMQAMSAPKPDPSMLVNILTKITNTHFLCKYLEVASGCYVGEAQTCKLDPKLKSYMEDQEKDFSNTCPAYDSSVGDGTKGKGGTGSASSLSFMGYLGLILTVTLSTLL